MKVTSMKAIIEYTKTLFHCSPIIGDSWLQIWFPMTPPMIETAAKSVQPSFTGLIIGRSSLPVA